MSRREDVMCGVADLLEMIEGAEITTELLVKHGELMCNIAKIAKLHPLYSRITEETEYQAFVKGLKESNKEDLLPQIFNLMLGKITAAPTILHAFTAVVMYMPIAIEYLPKNETIAAQALKIDASRGKHL